MKLFNNDLAQEMSRAETTRRKYVSSMVLAVYFKRLTKIFDELTPWLLVFVACNRLVLSRYPRSHHCCQTSRSALWSTCILLIMIIILKSRMIF